MYTIIVMLSFTGAQIAFYFYALSSKAASGPYLKVFLIPLIFFPILYLGNILYVHGWMFSNKTSLPVAVVGISYFAIGSLVFLGGQVFHLKEPLTIQMIIGAIVVFIGVIILNWK